MWLIVLGIIGVVALVAYRYYVNPPLPKTAKQQRENFIKRLHNEKILLYHMDMGERQQLQSLLGKTYLDAGKGCYYGKGVSIFLDIQDPQVAIHIFCASMEDLNRFTWRITQLKSKIGGVVSGTPHG